MARILGVDDDPDLPEVLMQVLGAHGHEVFWHANGQAAERWLESHDVDLLLLDINLPDRSGFEICERLRRNERTRTIRVIIVTGRDSEEDIVRGLELGADDYLTKPFGERELLARVSAVLRRGHVVENKGPIELGGLTINHGRREVLVNGQPVTLTATEFLLLEALASQPGQVFTRDQLLAKAARLDHESMDRTVDVHVKSIRQKLGPHRDWIETVRGVGYRFADAEPPSAGRNN